MRAEQAEITAIIRKEGELGRLACRRLRKQGLIPAVVYGRGAEPVAIKVEDALFERALHPAGWYSTLINLKIQEGGGGEVDASTVMIREVQRDLVERQIISIDFRRISLVETIQTHVPVRHVGESPGMKQGGVLDTIFHEVEIECLPTDIPDHIEVDISGLEIGGSVRVSDLMTPEGVKVLLPEEEVVMVVAPPIREEEIAPTPVEGEELVEEMAEPELIGEREEEEEEE